MKLEREIEGRDKIKIIRELKTLPNIGQKSAEQLQMVGVKSLDDIRRNKPEKIYEALLELENKNLDKIMLYVLRCAHYFLKTKNHDSELLKWWNWKDKK
jgi:recombinational DNA repair protein RecR